MKPIAVIKENWLTRKPGDSAYVVSALLTLLMAGANLWPAASGHAVFVNHEYWRLFTALFAHADLGHLLSNSLLFFPLTFLLGGYYSLTFFPVAALVAGMITNFIVLKYMPPEVSLLGMSGVVYWMGAAWLTLYVFVDRRRSLKHRIAVAIFLSVLLFVPQTYVAQTSYSSHLFGFLFGIICAVIYYFINRQKFLAAEVVEYRVENGLTFEESEALAAAEILAAAESAALEDPDPSKII